MATIADSVLVDAQATHALTSVAGADATNVDGFFAAVAAVDLARLDAAALAFIAEFLIGGVTGIFLGETEIACGHLVLAAGPWSREAETWLDISIPVDPLKGEILRLDLPGAPLKHDYSGGGGSLYPKPDGLVWCGTTEERQGFNKETTQSAREQIIQGVIKIIPDLAQAQLVLQTACLRPVTPDWLPILGMAPGWENVYLATGAGKKGILLAPGIGKSIADLITTGETTLSIQGYSPERFATQLD